MNDAAGRIAAARRVTVKIGSSLLIEGEDVRRAWLDSVAEDLAALRAAGKHTVVVSSGAVALGRGKLGLKRSARLDLKQAAAAAGQPRLMAAWEAAMARAGIPTAQLLLTVEDTESRRRWLNARATMEVLLREGALPVVNENDSVATEELRYGDNDRLSARVAQMIRSDVLILLSDVDGLYTADPSREPGAEHLPFLDAIDETIEGFAGGAGSAGVGTGGMRTKIAAARIARGFGCATIIAHGHAANPLRALQHGARATVIAASGSPAGAYKQWIAGTLEPAGSVTIDEGAVRALAGGKSLLPAGVRAVGGVFERGVCLRVLDPAGREVARGLSAYTSAEAQAIAGCVSAAIAERLGYSGPDELIHRDDLVLV
ncbi:glutamate 5-kinase [Sphingomonas parva]|uniref:Glutamate 5-kinase n=2 Tax=Sphingomonas parva TaxID=2555898 RepID=A0A4Y8ZU53_9SPHN|nr:glutamate 5-kinase [Sphingomonas parva]